MEPKRVTIENDGFNKRKQASQGRLCRKLKERILIWKESQKESLRFLPAPSVGVEWQVSRVEMNAKYAPLTPACPHRCSRMLIFRSEAPKSILTTPTLSYMGHQAPGEGVNPNWIDTPASDLFDNL